MSISTAPLPSPPKKKSGFGCLGCGCAVLAVLAVLFAALVGGLFYLGYKTVFNLSSETPPAITTFDGGDDLYEKTRHKLGDFDHDVQNHQPATVRLSADELNTLAARDPNLTKHNIHVYITMTDSEGRVQASFPTELATGNWVKGRYASFDISFALHFNASTKSIEITPHALQLADKPILGLDAENNQSAQTMIAPYIPIFNKSLTDSVRKNSEGALLLNQAKTMEVQGGQLVIETQ